MSMTLTEQRDAWVEMTSCEAWKWLEAILVEQAGTRANMVLLNPLSTADGVYQQEFVKGEFAAFQLCAKMPQLEIDRLTEEIKDLNKEQRDEEL